MSTGITAQGGTDRLNRILKLYHSTSAENLSGGRRSDGANCREVGLQFPDCRPPRSNPKVAWFEPKCWWSYFFRAACQLRTTEMGTASFAGPEARPLETACRRR